MKLIRIQSTAFTLILLTLFTLSAQEVKAQSPQIPKDLKWENNPTPPQIAAPSIKKGGTLRLNTSTFPLTLRTVGPDSNTVLYSALLANNWSLIDFHPNTREPINLLATHWAFGKDGKTVYYRLNKKAKWTDGKPVLADDFLFMLDFYRSKNIQGPWYNTFYTEQIKEIIKFDDHTIAVVLPNPKPDMLYNTALSPLPKHFYKGKIPKDFVTRYNWKAVPNTGPYSVNEKKLKKGKSITFQRKKDWWAKDYPFFQNRYNVDRVIYKVVREQTIEWEHFKRGKMDFFVMQDPLYWHERSKIDMFKKGWAHKLKFYNDKPRSAFGIWMNTASPFFNNLKVRQAVTYAANIEKVINTILRKEYTRMKSATHGYGKYSNPSVTARNFDIEKAKTLLGEAGYTESDKDGILKTKKGKRAEFKLLYASDGHKDKLVVLVEEMRKAGINMILDYKDWSAMVKQANANKHEAVFSGFGAREYGVPTYWSIFHGDNANKANTNNHTNINNKKLSDLISKYRSGTEEKQRIELAHQIQQIIYDEAIFIPTWVQPFFRIGYWSWWKFPKIPATNLSATNFDVFSPATGGLFWLDKQEKDKVLEAKDKNKDLGERTIENKTYQPRSGA